MASVSLWFRGVVGSVFLALPCLDASPRKGILHASSCTRGFNGELWGSANQRPDFQGRTALTLSACERRLGVHKCIHMPSALFAWHLHTNKSNILISMHTQYHPHPRSDLGRWSRLRGFYVYPTYFGIGTNRDDILRFDHQSCYSIRERVYIHACCTIKCISLGLFDLPLLESKRRHSQ